MFYYSFIIDLFDSPSIGAMVLGSFKYRCSRLNYRLPTVTGIFPSGLVRFQLIDYVPFVFVPVIPVSVFVRLKNVKVKMGELFFRPFPSVFRPNVPETHSCTG